MVYVVALLGTWSTENKNRQTQPDDGVEVSFTLFSVGGASI